MKAKLLLYLSVGILLLSSVLAMGDTFAIVQGSLNNSDSIYFQVYSDNTYLFDSFEVSSKNNFYAVSITIPSSYSQVSIIPVLKNESLFYLEEILHSGETLQLDILLTDNSSDDNFSVSSISTSSSSFEFQSDGNKKEIKDISSGVYEPYKEDIHIMPIPEIIKDIVLEEKIITVVDSIQNEPNKKSILPKNEHPFSQEKDTFLEKINTFVLQPIVLLSLALIGCILIVLIVLKQRRSEYL